MLLLVVFLPSVNYVRPEYELNEIATLKMLYESMANFSFIFMTTYLLVTNFKGKKNASILPRWSQLCFLYLGGNSLLRTLVTKFINDKKVR